MAAAIFSVACLLFAGVGVVSAIDEARGILRDGDIWQRGLTALAADVEGEETSHWLLFRRYDLNVSFVTVDQIRFTGRRVEFMTVLGWVDTANDPSVKYLASDANQIALSWAHDAANYRWLSVVLFGLMGIAVAAVTVWIPRAMLREWRVARAVSRQATEVELAVANFKPMTPGAAVGDYTLQGRSPWGAHLTETLSSGDGNGDPLFLDQARTTVLGLVSPDMPHRALVMRNTLLPLQFSEADVELIRKNIAGRRQ